MTEDNRIPKIRAVLDACADGDDCRCPVRIRAILDSAPPAPRVFFPGDTMPAGVAVGLVADPTVTEINEAVKGAVAAVLRELEAEAIRRGGDGVYWPFPGDLRTLADEIERDQ